MDPSNSTEAPGIGHVLRFAEPTPIADAASTVAGYFPDAAFSIAQTIEDLKFERFDVAGAPALLADHREGQVFSSVCEIRWKHHGDHCRLLFLGESSLPSDGWLEVGRYEVVDPAETATHGFFLWGNKRAGYWTEARIPRRLSYPTDSEVPRLRYCLYRGQSGGAVAWVRLKEVV